MEHNQKVYWRFKRNAPGPFSLAFVQHLSGTNLVRMGWYMNDDVHGPIVDLDEVEIRTQ